MGLGTTILLSLSLAFLGVAQLLAWKVISQINLRLSKILCAKLEIPPESMEDSAPVETPAPEPPKIKKRISVPVPMGWTPSDFRRDELKKPGING